VLELNEPDADEGGEAGPTVRRIGDFASATEQASRARHRCTEPQCVATEDEPVLELNEPATDVAESNDEAEPTGRRIDDILTTADTFNVAGFGEVRFARGLPTLTSSHARERTCTWTWSFAPQPHIIAYELRKRARSARRSH